MLNRTASSSTIHFTLILILAALAACSQHPSSDPPTPTVVRVWHTELDPDARRVLRSIMDEFCKANPSIRLEEEAIPWGQLNQKLIAGLASGDVPDLVHLQPFMAASLHRRGQLEPLDDVYAAIGLDDVFPAVRDLQLFDGKRYGIAHAVGCTYWAVRKDLMHDAGLSPPTTWAAFVDAAAKLTVRDANGEITRYGVMLPGDPFFIDQLSCELIASNGGHLFDATGKPDFTQQSVVEMLTFWRDISKYAPSNWSGTTYLDQFRLFAAGNVSMVPVTYARALKNIESDAPSGIGNTDVYGFIPTPTGPSGNAGYTTLDCEPWAILKSAKHADVARRFLIFLYDAPNYARFCRTVPVHLTPVLKSVATNEEYLNTPLITRWRNWQNRANEMLESPYAMPILFNRAEDRNVPYLMELSGERIITNAVLAVAVEGKDPKTAAMEAQDKALALLKRLDLTGGK